MGRGDERTAARGACGAARQCARECVGGVAAASPRAYRVCAPPGRAEGDAVILEECRCVRCGRRGTHVGEGFTRGIVLAAANGKVSKLPWTPAMKLASDLADAMGEEDSDNEVRARARAGARVPYAASSPHGTLTASSLMLRGGACRRRRLSRRLMQRCRRQPPPPPW